MSDSFWRFEDEEKLRAAKTYGELFGIAEEVLSRMPRPRGQLCGPISSGGAGSIEANLARFDAAIRAVEGRGMAIFDQMPFETHMQRIKQEVEGVAWSQRLLNEFYLPIFERRLVDKLFFLPDWETSRGATWEHEQAERLRIEIEHLPPDIFTNH